MTHFLRPEDAAVVQPGAIIRTACRELDYVDADGASTITAVASADFSADPTVIDSITCAECRAIAKIMNGRVTS